MGNRAARRLTLTMLTLTTALACGGRSIKDADSGSSGANNVAGAQSGVAGAQSGVAGGQNSAGATQNAAGAPAGGSNSWTECANDEDCVVLPRGCCPAAEPVDASELFAVNTTHLADYEFTQCPEPEPCIGPAGQTEYSETQKYFRGICVHPPTSGSSTPGKCQLLDVRGTPYTTCTTTSDCTLRNGVACCPECDSRGWVPVNGTTDFCTSSLPCSHCAAFPAEGLQTSCQGGTCRFVAPLR